jgi:hypothetical protein
MIFKVTWEWTLDVSPHTGNLYGRTTLKPPFWELTMRRLCA